MDEEARELFNKLVAGVSGVILQWTATNTFRIYDTQVYPDEITQIIKEYKIEEIK